MLRAEEELLASSFIVGDDPFTLTSVALLRDAARRGVEVLLTNSLATTDNLWPQAGYVGRSRGLVRRGVELRAWMDGHLESAVRIDRRGWPESACAPFPGVGCGKVVKLRLLQLLAPLVKRQL